MIEDDLRSLHCHEHVIDAMFEATEEAVVCSTIPLQCRRFPKVVAGRKRRHLVRGFGYPLLRRGAGTNCAGSALTRPRGPGWYDQVRIVPRFRSARFEVP